MPGQPLDFDNMRLRSGIKTPSAEDPNKAALPPNGNTPAAKPQATPTPKPKPSPTSAKRDMPASASAAKQNPSPRKRKVNPIQEEPESEPEAQEGEDESDDELAELEGALSAGEDDGSDSEGSNPDDESDDELENGDYGQDEEEDEALHSDEIPSDGEDDEESRKIPPLKPGQVPGLDPDDMNDGGEDLRNYRVETDARGNERYVYDEIDPVYDSDDTDANEPVNTIGDIDLKFYDSYPHIGYDINGKKIMRPAAGEALDALLDSIEVPKGWTGLTDPATGKPLNLSQDELELIKKIQMKELPQDGFDPYPVRIMP